MKRRTAAYAGLAVTGALVLTACTSGDGGSDGEGETITHTFEQKMSSYNGNPAEEYSAKNHIVVQRVQTGFWYYGEDGVVTPDEDFGSYEKTSDDPLTVEYTVNEDAVWSDGTPIDCDDMLLWWAANSGKFPDFSNAGTEGKELVETPDCEAGDKSYTAKFSEPFADWHATGGGGAAEIMPAHIVAEQGNLSEEEFIQAIKDGDTEAVAEAAKFYNSGWNFTERALPDESLIPSSGPYKLSAIAENSVTLTANDKWWGDPPETETVVIRNLNQEEQAQALENGEVDIIEPQINPDLLNQLEGLGGVEVFQGDQYLYDHLDFNFEGPFKDPVLREAFARCVPRQLIFDNLIKPVAPEGAAPQDVRNVAPFESDYEEVVEKSGSANKYAEADVAGAKKLLEDSGNVGLEVKIGYNTPNARRTQTVELVADSCNQAGFNVVDQGADNFFEEGGGLAENTYDVALFGWAGSPLVSGWASTYRTPDACTAEDKGNNQGCYSNPEVDKRITELNATLDDQKRIDLKAEIEKILWDDLATIPLFSHPYVAAWSDNLEGVVPNPGQSSITWNMDKWAIK